MRILAFDCAGAQCAAAIMAGGTLLAAKTIAADRGHARLLMPLLVDLLAEARLGFNDIDRFAVTTGPGSFTGIRVALAAAHGLAIGTGKPVVGVTVFEALAAAAVQSGVTAPRLLVAIESRRAECFVQLFDRQGEALTEARMLPPESVAVWAGPGPLALAGDAAWRIAPTLADRTDTSGTGPVDPAFVARIAATRIAGNPPAPFYLRAPDAVPRTIAPRTIAH
jgi:tRNA threonylcarbamoyladenosine biosynthesis protein TsaB